MVIADPPSSSRSPYPLLQVIEWNGSSTGSFVCCAPMRPATAWKWQLPIVHLSFLFKYFQPEYFNGTCSWVLHESCSSAPATAWCWQLLLVPPRVLFQCYSHKNWREAPPDPPGVLLQCFSHSRVLIAPPCSFRSSILLLQPQYGDHPLNTFHQESCSSTPRQSMLLAVSPGPFRNPSAISPAPCQLFLGLCGEWISGNTSIVSWGQDHLDLSARQCKDRLAWTGQEAASACL